ncbi:MAG: ABC transporter permease [Clostridia bacterium]
MKTGFFTNLKNEPPVRVVKREGLPLWKNAIYYFSAIVFALFLGGVFIAITGNNPFLFYATVFTGSFSNIIHIKNLIAMVVPLTITSLGIAYAFKMKFWNIGAEGQFLMGAFIATAVALALGDTLPQFITVVIVALSGALGGGLYGVIIALLKVRFNTNETLLSLMFNYIALYIVSYCVYVEFFKKPTQGIPTYEQIPRAAWLTEFKNGPLPILDTALIICVLLVVFTFIYFRFTKQGYEIAVVGDSPATANYAGMKVKRIIVRTMFISASIIGLAGALQLMGISSSHTMTPGITGGMGWDGIIVAWLAKLNPFGILITSFLLSVLEKGCGVARTAYGISEAVAAILQGIILFSVLAFDFFLRYKLVFRKRQKSVAKEESL